MNICIESIVVTVLWGVAISLTSSQIAGVQYGGHVTDDWGQEGAVHVHWGHVP